MKKGFSLMEILVVVALLVTLAVALLVGLNPLAQIDKGQDGKRKQELAQLSKLFEDYYNDKNCYPLPSKVCYDAPIQRPDQSYVCYICGNDPSSPADFNPYLSRLPCDSRQPIKKYLYQVDSLTCPSLFRIYSYLAYTADPATKEYCTTDDSGETNYNWGVSSSNTKPMIDCNTSSAPGNYYCQNYNNCSQYDSSLFNCTPNYADPNCGDTHLCQSTKGTCIGK